MLGVKPATQSKHDMGADTLADPKERQNLTQDQVDRKLPEDPSCSGSLMHK